MIRLDTTTLAPAQANSDNDALARAFLDALVARDFDRLRALLVPGAGMRALTPRKVIEDAGADAVVSRFALWYASAQRLDVHETRTGVIGQRGVVQYRFRTWSDDGTRDIVQHAFLDARGGRIHRIDLICSGFLPADGGA